VFYHQSNPTRSNHRSAYLNITTRSFIELKGEATLLHSFRCHPLRLISMNDSFVNWTLIFWDAEQYIFQKVVNGNAIEHHLWMLQPSLTTYKVQDLEFSHLEALRQRFSFVFLGATTTSNSTNYFLPNSSVDMFVITHLTENVKRFTKRERKLKSKCAPASRCPKKIRRLERNLLLKEVIQNKECPNVQSK